MGHGRRLDGWQTTTRRTPAGTVESAQVTRASAHVVEHSPAGARRLGEAYWSVVRAATGGLVRAHHGRDGIELRVLGLAPLLLAFAEPDLRAGESGVSCRYPIRGGLLSRGAGGHLLLSQVGDSPCELRSEIADYNPRLAAREGRPGWTGALYTVVQRRFHDHVSRRYFRALLGGAAR